ncbi:Mut7-C RNAse domain-containing protein [Halorubrum sp. 2020YC2]|uniref:Mut7-C RNAse domain-containing protein n=1 Tax=Halorubrum sp. 2020YC2 TaxID=2836432 RepID=UPI001BED0E14|nr:Mut7-C RNAse domain-containing protein [Halorubrum sp. 2020YC2]QWC19621.1 Mut7-C RNAse domain-containing protein [Halorubrum sp. 2020YC2]
MPDRDEDGADSPPGRARGPGDRPPVLLDVMCGKLATYLRFCGYDAAYALDRGAEADDRLLSLAAAEGRTLITRDRELADRAPGADPAVEAVLLTERDPLDQLRELDAAGFPVELAAEPSRCGACNGPVERVGAGGDDGDGGPDGFPPADRPGYVPDDVGVDRPGWRCTDCGRWFWKGGHWDDVAARLGGI